MSDISENYCVISTRAVPRVTEKLRERERLACCLLEPSRYLTGYAIRNVKGNPMRSPEIHPDTLEYGQKIWPSTYSTPIDTYLHLSHNNKKGCINQRMYSK